MRPPRCCAATTTRAATTSGRGFTRSWSSSAVRGGASLLLLLLLHCLGRVEPGGGTAAGACTAAGPRGMPPTPHPHPRCVRAAGTLPWREERASQDGATTGHGPEDYNYKAASLKQKLACQLEPLELLPPGMVLPQVRPARRDGSCFIRTCQAIVASVQPGAPRPPCRAAQGLPGRGVSPPAAAGRATSSRPRDPD